jgi:hypothetical protein
MEDLDEYMARIVGWAAVYEATRKKWLGQTQVKITKVQAWTDQRPTTHASCIINCPSRTRLFQCLSIKQLALDG